MNKQKNRTARISCQPETSVETGRKQIKIGKPIENPNKMKDVNENVF